ncbi:hypothetical protein MG293_019244 [Ovis ammon polii]|uniref:Uncharacterized protein n=1 Tax=Ovis ammon polii TaxID=230172 RepID=A0AAD4TQ61_OVIAM|nr:hypothetical protein MG293_019244 [Ovis ammon polii]
MGARMMGHVMGAAADRSPQGPLGTLCGKACWVFFAWVGMSRPSDCEGCVSTGFQKRERETRDSPVLTWQMMPSFLPPHFRNTSGSLSSRCGGRGARLFELVTVGSARLITVVLTSRTKHNFQLIKQRIVQSVVQPLLKRDHFLFLVDCGHPAAAAFNC